VGQSQRGRSAYAAGRTGITPLQPPVRALRIAIDIAWLSFWIFWVASAVGVKQTVGSSRRRIPLGGATVVAVVLVVRLVHPGGLALHSPILGASGAAVIACGLALAIWARVQLGRNWGTPMSQKAHPELITSGPYRIIRHPIYSGLLLGVIGTALVTNLAGLLIAAIVGAFFYYCASVEETNLIAAFPAAYPAYRRTTKMLIPFVL
jgi:protein-S-isoprenylcysteine O-methyltransferase Ste14